MNTVMRTLGGALGGQLSASFIAGNVAKGLPTVTGFTDTFAMATGFLVVCFLSGLLVPREPAGHLSMDAEKLNLAGHGEVPGEPVVTEAVSG
jgi:hypothetical protein